jgi:protein phosphatase
MRQARVLFETGAATHVGKVRSRNEDCYLTRPEAGLWAVADGMGGHEDGDVASRAVIEALESIGAANSASELLTLCENRIFDANSQLQEISRQRGIITGTTVVVLLVSDGYFASLWCGDSRLYRVRHGDITQLSRDHTEVQDLLSSGAITPEQASNWPGRNVITRAIGVFEIPELELSSDPLNTNDTFIICTDGLTQHVRDAEILQCVSDNSTPQQACDRLIELTLERGALDNVTIVVVRYSPDFGAKLDAGNSPAGVSEQFR